MKILIEKAVIEQALKAIETSRGQWIHSVNATVCLDTITALREALAEQAKQEPVCIDWDTKTDEPIMGYAAPVRTKDLTDEEMATLIQRYTIDGKVMPFALCEAVIAADREKNK